MSSKARSTAQRHADWLGLLDISGPFLSIPVLIAAEGFQQGLPTGDDESSLRRDLASYYEQWRPNAGSRKPDPALDLAWFRTVIEDVLGWTCEVTAEGQSIPPGFDVWLPEHKEALRPDLVLRDPEGSDPRHVRLLVQRYPAGQALDKPIGASRWSESPANRMVELLRRSGVRLGLATNGEKWMLVNAPAGEPSGFASWYAGLWFEERTTLTAFRALLGVERFFAVDENATLEQMLIASAQDQANVTTQLGDQVRQAVELLVAGIDEADQERGGRLLAGVSEAEVYEAAITVMMRLVFLLFAEDHRPPLFGGNNGVYDQHYSVSALVEQLEEIEQRDGEQILEHKKDAWPRLLATFRLVHAGSDHDLMRQPAYGGSLFDPDRFPFLEGRLPGTGWASAEATPLPLTNRTVLHMLQAIQFLEMRGGKQGTTRQRLSFRALDVEQIGHVYEQLLEHTAKRAEGPVLALTGTAKKEPEIALADLEAWRAKGEEHLLKLLKAETDRSPSALKKLLAAELDPALEQKLRAICATEEIFRSVLPFAGLVRLDRAGRPLVIRTGGLYVTKGDDRRTTGAHYTPRSLTESIVQHTLEPLIYDGPTDGKPREEWRLKTPTVLLDLRICDPAMGSGAFLVQTCRYLADRLVEAWEQIIGADLLASAFDSTPAAVAPGLTNNRHSEAAAEEPYAKRSSPSTPHGHPVAPGLVPGVQEDPHTINRHPEAVGADGASRPSRPPSQGDFAGEAFTQADHGTATPAIRLYISPDGSLSRGNPSELILPRDKAERLTIARRLVADHCLYGVDVNPLAVDMAKLSLWLVTLQKDRPFTFLDHRLRCGDSLLGVGDIDQLRGFSLEPGKKGERDIHSRKVNRYLQFAIEGRRRIEDMPANDAAQVEEKARSFRDIEQVMDGIRLGADLLVGAALADKRLREDRRKEAFRRFTLIANLLPDATGREFRAGHVQVSLAENEETAQRWLDGNRPFHWPLEFPEIFIDSSTHEAPKGFSAIVGNPPFLGGSKLTGTFGHPYRDFLVDVVSRGMQGNADLAGFFLLRSSALICGQGYLGLVMTNSIAQGDTRSVGLDRLVSNGFTITGAVKSMTWPGVAATEVSLIWLSKGLWRGHFHLDGKASVAITTYLTEPGTVSGDPYPLAENNGLVSKGSDIGGVGFAITPEQAAAILESDARYGEVLFPYLNGEDLYSRSDQSPSRWVINFHDWPLERAKHFPLAMKIVRENVKPFRERSKSKAYRDWWWQYARRRTEFYQSLETRTRILARALVSSTWAFAFIEKGTIPDAKLAVFAFDHDSEAGELQSSLRYWWAVQYSTTMKRDISYTIQSTFETYPRIGSQSEDIALAMRDFASARQEICCEWEVGLTTVWNRMNDPAIADNEFANLRESFAELDRAVVRAYGWDDLDLEHGFHETKQGVRFTISERAQREVLDRLLELNHRRYSEEVEQGLHEKGAKRTPAKARQTSLL
jgi:hypothetical protein